MSNTLTTIEDAITQVSSNLKYWESESSALSLYEALMYLQINRPTQSALNTMNMSFQSLENLTNKVEAHIKALQYSPYSIASLNRYF